MKHYLILLFIGIGFASCSSSKAISVDKFEKKIASTENVVLLDVRTPKEFAEGHLHNAINIDYRGALKASLDSLDKKKVYLVYCKSGGRSARSIEMMDSAGFKHVVDLKGGITAWRKAGKPVVLGEQDTTVNVH